MDIKLDREGVHLQWRDRKHYFGEMARWMGPITTGLKREDLNVCSWAIFYINDATEGPLRDSMVMRG